LQQLQRGAFLVPKVFSQEWQDKGDGLDVIDDIFPLTDFTKIVDIKVKNAFCEIFSGLK
jgi:hypothetical protein